MDTDVVEEQSGRLNAMRTIREVLGHDCRKPFVSLSWEGRNESALELSTRILATLQLISARFPAGTYSWFKGPSDIGETPAPVPEAPMDLAEMVRATFDMKFGSYYSRSLLSLFLLEGPTKLLDLPSAVTVRAGSGDSNQVTVDLPEDFPLGDPSDAARLFLDLVRIWQPDLASFSTISAVRALMETKHSSHAAYLAWSSFKAHIPARPTERELVIPFGDGWMYVAKEWTVPALVALHNEIAPEKVKGPDLQDPPSFPDGYPAVLDELDGEILWGGELNE